MIELHWHTGTFYLVSLCLFMCLFHILGGHLFLIPHQKGSPKRQAPLSVLFTTVFPRVQNSLEHGVRSVKMC